MPTKNTTDSVAETAITTAGWSPNHGGTGSARGGRRVRGAVAARPSGPRIGSRRRTTAAAGPVARCSPGVVARPASGVGQDPPCLVDAPHSLGRGRPGVHVRTRPGRSSRPSPFRRAASWRSTSSPTRRSSEGSGPPEQAHPCAARSSSATSRFRTSTMRVTSSSGIGSSAGNRMVPLPTANGRSSSPSSASMASLHGKRL